MRRSLMCVFGVATAFAVTLGAASHVHAGAPDDGSVDDPTTQAPAFSVQGPAIGPGAPATPSPPAPSSSAPTLPPSPPAAQPSDPTAVRIPSSTGIPFATAQCHDGWFSYSQTREGTCAGHEGVLMWITQPDTSSGVLWERQEQAAGLLGNGWLGTAPIAPGQATALAPAPCTSISGGPCVTQCVDGQWSSSTGSGTCSDHGGEAALNPYEGGNVPGCGTRGGSGVRLPNGQCALLPSARF
jgi:Protein of unknown function (DUF3761)